MFRAACFRRRPARHAMSAGTCRQPSVTVGDVSERDLIARIERRLPPHPDWVLIGIGDDAAVVEPERNRVEVLTVDALVEGVHFDRAFVPPDAIGHRALAVNLSDLAAMGAAPRLALVSMALPATLLLADFESLVDGMVSLAARARVAVVGGNLTRSTGPLVIDITAIGSVKRRQALVRGGARPGDELYVSGTIGSALAGRLILSERHARRTTADSPVPVTTDDSRLTTAYLRPEPRLRLGMLLARNRAASACIDLSDGLSDAVYRVAESSGVGAFIDADALPIEARARALFESRGVDPVQQAATAGDDYELLVAVRPRLRSRLSAAMRHGDARLTRIGVCTRDRAVVIRRDGANIALPRDGYAHFGRA
jgi:thiamine-monophosphate kinase